MCTRAEIWVRKRADLGGRPAPRPRVDAPADDPRAEPAELDRQRAVELAARIDILEAELLQKHRGIDSHNVEGQPPRLRRVEIEQRGMEHQLAAGERPAPALDPHAIVAEQPIFDRAANDRNARIHLLQRRGLPRRRTQAQQVVEVERARQAGDGAESRSEEHTYELQSLMSISYAVV